MLSCAEADSDEARQKVEGEEAARGVATTYLIDNLTDAIYENAGRVFYDGLV